MSHSTGQPWVYSERPPQWVGFFHDFLSDEDLTEYVITAINAGTGVVSDTLENGVMRLASNGGAANSGAEFQVDCAPFAGRAGIQMECQASFYFSHATNNLFGFGFAELDTSWAAGVADGIFIRIDDTDGQVDLTTRSNGVTTDLQTNLMTIAASTWYHFKLSVVWTSQTEGEVSLWATYVDATTNRRITTLLYQGTASALPGQTARGNMSQGGYWQTGASASAGTLDVDYNGAQQLRYPSSPSG